MVFGAGGPFSYGDASTANVALAVLLNGIGILLVHIGGSRGYDGNHYGRVVVPVPVNGISSGADSSYYVGYALDGGAMSADRFTIKLGPYYSINEGVKGDKEGGTKMTVTTTMTVTDTASLSPPPGWNMIKFVIGNLGNNNIDSWVFLRTGLFLCIVVGGGVESRVRTTTKGNRGTRDSAAALLNVSKMDTSATWYTVPIRRHHPHLPWPICTFVAGDWYNFLQQMHNNRMTQSYKRGGSRESRGSHSTINQAVGRCIHGPGTTRHEIRP